MYGIRLELISDRLFYNGRRRIASIEPINAHLAVNSDRSIIMLNANLPPSLDPVITSVGLISFLISSPVLGI